VDYGSMLSVCVCHRPRCRGGGLFPGRNFPSHRRKKREKKKISKPSRLKRVTLFLCITFSEKKKRRKKKTLFRMDRWLSVGIISQKQRNIGTTKGEKRHLREIN
jgi:hypothetical protein